MSVAESSGLMPALRQLMPDALLSVTVERPWHSLTFAGTQLRVSAELGGEHHRAEAAHLVERLQEHQFALADMLVADIGVTRRASGDMTSRLIIDILLLVD